MFWQAIKAPDKVIEKTANSKMPFANRLSNRVHRKAVFTTISIILIAILSTIIVNSVSTIAVANANYIRGVGVGIYWDQACTNRTLTVDRGPMEAGSNSTVMVYIRNEGDSAVSLWMATSNWTPSVALGYMTVTWTYTGKILSAGEVIPIDLVLTISPTASGITDFSFDIIITATG